jgi:hypothetical protein
MAAAVRVFGPSARLVTSRMAESASARPPAEDDAEELPGVIENTAADDGTAL